MRLVSNSDSVRRGEPSVLAIAETIMASGISFWLAWRLGSVQHVVVAGALAPFLLLRTRLSTWYAIRLVARLEKILDFWVMLVYPFIRITATTRVFLRHPFNSVHAIPRNFYRDMFVVDLSFSPQFLPGSEDIKIARDKEYFELYSMLKNIYNKMNVDIADIIAVIFVVSLALPMIISSIIYRWSLKSTALLWLPLIWIFAQAQPGTQINDRLALITRSAWSKTMRVYSVLVMLIFSAKLAMFFGIWQIMNLNWLGSLGVLATRLMAPFDLPLWQVAGALNALLAWAFFFRADQHLLAQGTTEAWPEVWVRREYAIFQVVRTTLSLYVIACTFYIAAATAWQTEWPPIRFILFPWTA